MIRLPAPAKINLYLRVTGIRPDGMHELDTAFAYTDLNDWLTFRPASEIAVHCSEAQISGEANLVHRVLTAFRAHYGISQGLEVQIEKRIPHQAGLGGGSSDAATALLAANRLWQVGLDRETLIRFSAPFGADIPCFLYGRASVATGIGDTLRDYPDALPQQTLLLVRPGSGLSTPAVFRHFDRALAADGALTASEALDTMRRDPPQLSDNDLETSACSLNGDVQRLLQRMRETGKMAWMSGSGSACIALFDAADDAEHVAGLLHTSQLAEWTHIGAVVCEHPVSEDWDVAKR